MHLYMYACIMYMHMLKVHFNLKEGIIIFLIWIYPLHFLSILIMSKCIPNYASIPHPNPIPTLPRPFFMQEFIGTLFVGTDCWYSVPLEVYRVCAFGHSLYGFLGGVCPKNTPIETSIIYTSLPRFLALIALYLMPVIIGRLRIGANSNLIGSPYLSKCIGKCT